MQINVNGVDYTVPSSLMAITLQRRIEFDSTYGKALREKLNRIVEIQDTTIKELEFGAYRTEMACKTLAFFASIPLNIVEQTDLKQVMLVYEKTLQNYSEDVDFANKEWQRIDQFHWNGAVWRIAEPELTNNSSMTFGEFITAKQVVQDMIEYGNEKYGALLKLCCVYFRKEGEAFDEEFVDEESDRYRLMQTLPLQYGLHVGFFLASSMSTWISTFLSFGKQEAREQAYQ